MPIKEEAYGNPGVGQDSSHFLHDVRQLKETIGSLSGVHASLSSCLTDKWKCAVTEKHSMDENLRRLEGLLISSCGSEAHAKLQALESGEQVYHNRTVVTQLLEQLGHCSAEASSKVVQELTRRVQSDMLRVDATLEVERKANDDLANGVQELLAKSLRLVHESTRKAVDLEIAQQQKDAALAHLQAQNTFLNHKVSINNREVRALMEIVSSLVVKASNMEAAQRELQRSKHHVRVLERHLDLHGIAHAFAEDAAPVSAEPTGTAPPPADLQAVAPEYYTLRWLEHKGMTIAEVVNSLFECREEAEKERRRNEALMREVQQVEHNARIVHQRYLEEKQRREVCDRRIVEMARERLRPTSRGALEDELTKLRSNYSRVVDDATQLAVSLTVSRDELQAALQDNASLKEKIQQMERDAETDHIFQTLSSLRGLYEENCKRVMDSYEMAETQKTMALQLCSSQRREYASGVSAYNRSADINRDLCKELEGKERRRVLETAGRDASQAVNMYEQTLQKCNDRLQRSIKDVRSLNVSHSSNASQALQQYARQIADLVNTFSKFSTSAPSRSAGPAACSSSSSPATEKQRCNDELMRRALEKSFSFVFSHMSSAEAQRTVLVDRAISDSDYLSILQSEVESLSKERASLQSRLDEALMIITQNSLAVVENATQQQMSVEDSLNAAEAKEKISTLTAQLEGVTVSKLSVDAQLQKEESARRSLEAQLADVGRRLSVAVSRGDQLSQALRESHERECAANAEVLRLQEFLRAGLTLPPVADSGATAPLEAATTDLQQLLEHIRNAVESKRRQEDLCRLEASAKITLDDVQAAVGRDGVVAVVALLERILANLEQYRSLEYRRAVTSLTALSSAATEEETTPLMRMSVAASAAEEANARMKERLAQVEDSLNQTEQRNIKLLEMVKRIRSLSDSQKQTIDALTLENEALKSATSALPPTVTVDADEEQAQGEAETDTTNSTTAPDTTGAANHQNESADSRTEENGEGNS